jgi:hypothetical protein
MLLAHVAGDSGDEAWHEVDVGGGRKHRVAAMEHNNRAAMLGSTASLGKASARATEMKHLGGV